MRSPVRNITPRSRGASPLSLTRSLPPFRAPPLSSVAAASLAIVATAGIAAVHPSAGGVIVSSSSRLGQSDAEHPHDHGALDHANHPVDDVRSIEATSPDDPTADSSEMTEAAHMYDDLVEHPHAARAAVALSDAEVTREGAREELENEKQALTLAENTLAAAVAEADKMELLAKQRAEETKAAEADVLVALADATEGSASVAATDSATQETADLAADKRAYLLARGAYAESTELVETRKTEFDAAVETTKAAQSAFEHAKTVADAAKAKSDEMARAMEAHQEETKAAPEVGEEAFGDGVKRAQTMAQITAAATKAQIDAEDAHTEAANAQKTFEDALLAEKTARETLDAELKRRNALKEASTKNQRAFVDASNRAAQDATAAADVSTKSKEALKQARLKLSAARTAQAAAEDERDHLRQDIVATRRREYDAARAKTNALRAKADVYVAQAEEMAAVSKVEDVKREVVKNAEVATKDSKFAEAHSAAAAAREEAEVGEGIAEANAINAAAADESVRGAATAAAAAEVIPDTELPVRDFAPRGDRAEPAAEESSAETSSETPSSSETAEANEEEPEPAEEEEPAPAEAAEPELAEAESRRPAAAKAKAKAEAAPRSEAAPRAEAARPRPAETKGRATGGDAVAATGKREAASSDAAARAAAKTREERAIEARIAVIQAARKARRDAERHA